VCDYRLPGKGRLKKETGIYARKYAESPENHENSREEFISEKK